MSSMPIRTAAGLLLIAALHGAACRRESAPARKDPRPAPDAALEHREEGLRYWVLPDEAAALHVALRSSPLLVGFGELHQKKGSAKVPSAVQRFGGALLTALAPRSSDLIVETWMTEGRCGEKEKTVARQVEKTTERPASTENEVVTLLRRSKGLGVQPHILTVSCRDYEQLLGGGAVDYGKLLSLVTKQLSLKAERVWRSRQQQPRRDGGPAQRRAIVLYGGALHNDRFPVHEELRPYTYAQALDKLSGGRFVEVDLYVPEYLDGDQELAGQRWFSIFRRHASAERLLLIERGERSFILVFRRTSKGSPRP